MMPKRTLHRRHRAGTSEQREIIALLPGSQVRYSP